MSSILTIILIGLSLSMDAFSLSLAYGMIGLTQKDKIVLSLVVGIFHFVMPLIGLSLGSFIETYFLVNLNIITTIILIYLGLILIISKEEIKDSFFLFGLSVSIDSLIIGIGLKSITNYYLLSSLIFMIISTIITYIGLSFGNILGKKVGEYSRIIGGITLIAIAIILFVT